MKRLTTGREVEYSVGPTWRGAPSLPPITLAVDQAGNPMRSQDYLTPGEARALSLALLNAAVRAEA